MSSPGRDRAGVVVIAVAALFACAALAVTVTVTVTVAWLGGWPALAMLAAVVGIGTLVAVAAVRR